MDKNAQPLQKGKLEAVANGPAVCNFQTRAPQKTERSLRCNYTERELLEIGKKLASSHLKAAGLLKRGRGRATAHGTVSVPSDEGSRDDMGEDSKNNL